MFVNLKLLGENMCPLTSWGQVVGGCCNLVIAWVASRLWSSPAIAHLLQESMCRWFIDAPVDYLCYCCLTVSYQSCLVILIQH